MYDYVALKLKLFGCIPGLPAVFYAEAIWKKTADGA